MRKNQSQNKRPLLKKEVFTDVSHADKQRSRQRECECRLTQPCGLVGIKGIAVAGEVAERKDEKAGSSAPTNPPIFMRHFLSCRLRQFLELHLGSESDNDGVPRPSAHIGVILHNWLKQDHRRDIQENIELKAVFVIPVSGMLGRKSELKWFIT
jgi:hypothetical protein